MEGVDGVRAIAERSPKEILSRSTALNHFPSVSAPDDIDAHIVHKPSLTCCKVNATAALIKTLIKRISGRRRIPVDHSRRDQRPPT